MNVVGNIGIKGSFNNLMIMKASEVLPKNETVVQAVKNVSNTNKKLSVNHINKGPVSTSSGVRNFKLLKGLYLDVRS